MLLAPAAHHAAVRGYPGRVEAVVVPTLLLRVTLAINATHASQAHPKLEDDATVSRVARGLVDVTTDVNTTPKHPARKGLEAVALDG